MKILIAAGGTGGHIFPGIAIAEELKNLYPKAEIVFVGTHVGMESKIIPEQGYRLELINARGFERGFSKETIEAVIGTLKSILDVRNLLNREKPDLVIGTGGFTSAMLLVLAAVKKIPTIIHEQNAYPGRSNRLAGKFVNKIGLSFSEAADYFDRSKTFVCGNPVRDDFKKADRKRAREKLGLTDQKVVIFTGGSQGARKLDLAAIEVIKNRPDLTYFFLTGKDYYNEIKEELEKNGLLSQNINLYDFYQDMANLMSAADLIVSRSGASTITEIATVGIPSILIPYPTAAGDHQTANAKVLSETGGAILIPESELSGKRLLESIAEVLDNTELSEEMRKNTKSQSHPDATKQFVEVAADLIDGE